MKNEKKEEGTEWEWEWFIFCVAINKVTCIRSLNELRWFSKFNICLSTSKYLRPSQQWLAYHHLSLYPMMAVRYLQPVLLIAHTLFPLSPPLFQTVSTVGDKSRPPSPQLAVRHCVYNIGRRRGCGMDGETTRTRGGAASDGLLSLSFPQTNHFRTGSDQWRDQ